MAFTALRDLPVSDNRRLGSALGTIDLLILNGPNQCLAAAVWAISSDCLAAIASSHSPHESYECGQKFSEHTINLWDRK